MFRLGRMTFAAATFLLSIALSPLTAQPWDGWPYRPEYDFGWGYLPPLGFGFNWKYPYVREEYYAPSAAAVAYCTRRFRSYDPVSQTYLGYDGFRHPCP